MLIFLFFCLKEYPDITLIDSQRRKLALLEKYCIENFKGQIKFIYSRAEEVQSKKFDIAVTRSSIPFPWSAEISLKLIKANGFFIPFLGKLENVEESGKFLNKMGFQLEKNIHLKELNFLGDRHIIFLKKSLETEKGFPRSWKIIKEEMRHNGENRLD